MGRWLLFKSIKVTKSLYCYELNVLVPELLKVNPSSFNVRNHTEDIVNKEKNVLVCQDKNGKYHTQWKEYEP